MDHESANILFDNDQQSFCVDVIQSQNRSLKMFFFFGRIKVRLLSNYKRVV